MPYYVVDSDVVEAWQWIPGDMTAAGAIIGTLMAKGVPFHHPSGAGSNTTLRLGTRREDGPLARPGDWLINSAGKWGITEATEFALKAQLFEGRRLPLDIGTRVYHLGQQWAYSLPGGTGEIVARKGPDHRGDFEYKVRTGKDISRQPGPDNPETDERWWASYTTIPAVPATGSGEGR